MVARSRRKRSDAELDSLAKKNVTTRIEAYEKSNRDAMAAFMYRGADRPLDEQIAEERHELDACRKKQQEIMAAIDEVRAYDPRSTAKLSETEQL